MSERTKELEKAFNILKKRIMKHRQYCDGWINMHPCFNCHVNTLTKIEKLIEEIKYE